MNTEPITVKTTINAPLANVWECWTSPKHIIRWCQASDDWHAPHAKNDVRVGGTFTTRMEAKDGSAGFDFSGTYTEVQKNSLLAYSMEDGRNVKITFSQKGDNVEVLETFDPEHENPREMQQHGWQAILDHFKNYVEKQT